MRRVNREFQEALPVLSKLKKNGFEAYFVGGSVRDQLLGKPIKDVDIASSATPDQVQQLFQKTVDIGSEHGTVIVIENGTHYEITTFRTESAYEDNRRPSGVTFVSSLKEDLKRRDFTINAMAMDENGSIIDYFNGREDAQKKRISTVGSPAERFSEDALRMMRAVRFVSQLGFSLSESTHDAIASHISLLQHISAERKTAEFEKTMAGSGCSEGMRLIAETGMTEYLPGLKEKKQQILKAAELPFYRLNSNEERWTAFLDVIGIGGIEAFLKKWKLSNRQIGSIRQNLLFLEERRQSDWTKVNLYRAGLQCALQTEAVFCLLSGLSFSESKILEIKARYHSLPVHSKRELAVNGNDLMAFEGRKPGPWLSEYMEKIELAVVNGQVENSKEAIKEMLKSCNLN